MSRKVKPLIGKGVLMGRKLIPNFLVRSSDLSSTTNHVLKSKLFGRGRQLLSIGVICSIVKGWLYGLIGQAEIL